MTLASSPNWFSPVDEALANFIAGEYVLFAGLSIAVLLLCIALSSGRRLRNRGIVEALRSDGALESVGVGAMQIGAVARLEAAGKPDAASISAELTTLSKQFISFEAPLGENAVSFAAGVSVHVTFTSRSGLLFFDSVVKDTRAGQHVITLFTSVPETLYRLQRRRSFRVPVEMPVLLAVLSSADAEDVSYRGVIENLSGGGFRVAVAEPLQLGTFVRCRLPLPGILRSSFRARVVTCQYDVRRDGLSTAVHCEFVDLDEETRNEIINYCFGVEKEEHRRNKLVATR